ncbi:MAG: undecaprenyl-diphosphate phosphatase [Rhodopseudomonas palustris]|nr:undecaprenyl-diphosphate phosphatase [Rhodopseudomonas palustris]
MINSLGIVQGIAEILPISSSGHLVLLQQLLKCSLPIPQPSSPSSCISASLVALLIFFS